MAQHTSFPFTATPSSQPQQPSSLSTSGETFVFSSGINSTISNDPLATGGVKLGSMVFKTHDSLFNYLHNALMTTKLGQDVRYDECVILVDLLKKGHEKATEKIGCGISSIRVEYHPGFKKSKCFMLYRKDGSKEDFSCIILLITTWL